MELKDYQSDVLMNNRLSLAIPPCDPFCPINKDSSNCHIASLISCLFVDLDVDVDVAFFIFENR